MKVEFEEVRHSEIPATISSLFEADSWVTTENLEKTKTDETINSSSRRRPDVDEAVEQTQSVDTMDSIPIKGSANDENNNASCSHILPKAFESHFHLDRSLNH